MADHFTYRVSWSEEDGEHVGTCLEFPSLSHLAGDPSKALDGVRKLVADVVADMKANNKLIPTPRAEVRYSGKFMTRIPPELHRRLAIEAEEEKISLNRLVSARLLMARAIAGAASMSDGTITAVDPRALIWWHGVPLCRRPQPDPPQPKQPPGRHFRRGVYLTDEQLEMYRLLRRKRIPVATALKMAKAPRGPSGLSDLARRGFLP